MKTTFQIIFLVFTLSLFSCGDDESPQSGCCANPSILAPVGAGQIYIPNVFTPDGDGINDRLIVHAGPNIAKINYFEILYNDVVIYQVKNFLPNDFNLAWDGTVNGSVEKDIFTVKVGATSTLGIEAEAEGKVCSFPCNNEPKQKAFDHILDCQFGDQHDGLGGFGTNINSQQQWDCLE